MRKSPYFSSSTNSSSSGDPPAPTASTLASTPAPAPSASTSRLPPRLIPKPPAPSASMSTTSGDFSSARSMLPPPEERAAAASAASPARPVASGSGSASARPAGSPASASASTSVGNAPKSGPVQFNNQQANAGPNGAIKRTTNSIVVNICQKGNPVISHIRNIAWEYGDIVSDYQVGATTGVLYLSLRYHQLHPEYIHSRIARIGQSYSLRILLLHCDADNHAPAMRELNKVALVMGYTAITAWTAQEAGRYLELLKSFERKPPDLIRAPVDDDYMSHLTSALTSIKSVNKTDVATLSSSLGSFAKIVTASAGTLNALPGLGDKKVKRIREACEATFVVRAEPKKKVARAGDIRASMNRAASKAPEPTRSSANPVGFSSGTIRGGTS